jgi:hypothetical protein
VKRRYEFRAQMKGAEIVIYDEIGAFGIPAGSCEPLPPATCNSCDHPSAAPLG